MTSTWLHLSNAPITEAIIEFQFNDTKISAIDSIRNASKLLESDYPIEQEKKSQVIRAVINDDTPSTEYIDRGVVGFVRRSEDGKKVIQFMLDRFAFSYLPPYPSWDVLEQKAIEAWDIYQEEMGIKFIKRVGVRFINRIEIELPMNDLEDYLFSPPTIPDKLPQAIMEFDQRVVLPNREIEAVAIINQSSGGVNSEKNVASVILDIDVGKSGRFETSKGSILTVLKSLHKYKNEIFFGYIKPKALEKYK